MDLKHAVVLSLLAGAAMLYASPITVPFVDLSRYEGTWYEIAKIPNRFQKSCASGTTATYRLLPNGKVEVINRCRKENGKETKIKGIAQVVDTNSNARLKVSFVRFLWKNWFYGDYWIIGLDENYQWAIVGTPNRKYGWILAREKTLTDAQRAEIFNILQRQGYNPDDFVETPQE